MNEKFAFPAVGHIFGKLYLVQLRNEFDFWNVHGIMNTSDLLKSK